MHPQDGLWSWLVCFCATFAAAIIPGLSFSFGALLPTLMSYFNSGRERTGIVLYCILNVVDPKIWSHRLYLACGQPSWSVFKFIYNVECWPLSVFMAD